MKTCPKCNAPHEKSGTFCSRACANSRVWTDEDKKKKSVANIGHVMSKESKLKISSKMKGRKVTWICPRDETKKKISLALKLYRANNPYSESRLKQFSDFAKSVNFGGHTSKRKVSFKKLDGTIVYLQSSYEERYAKFLEDKNVKWIRPDPLKWVDDQNIDHRYYPDFYLIDFDVYVDTKNDFLIIKDANKISKVVEQNSVTIKILSSKELDWLPMAR